MTRDEAWALLTEFNSEEFHLKHAQTVEGVMRYFASELGYADEADFWANVGLLHDLDFEKFPEEHCRKEEEILRSRGVDERLIHAVVSHGYGITVDTKPEPYSSALCSPTMTLRTTVILLKRRIF